MSEREPKCPRCEGPLEEGRDALFCRACCEVIEKLMTEGKVDG